MAVELKVDDFHSKHLFDGQDVLNVYNTEVINLSAGAPGPDLLKLCTKLFTQATAHRMAKEAENAYLFQYGITSGLWEYREELAKFLTRRYGEKVNREDLILTSGATHGVHLILSTFLPHNAVIFVEEVTYMIALEVFHQFPTMKIVPVPMTPDGVDTVALEEIATKERSSGKWNLSDEKLFWAVFYTIPLHHNPTGISMSPECCRSVVEVARKLNFVVLCDDVYNILTYTSDPPRRLFSYDTTMLGYKGGHVISNGTFSKIMAPGVRIGWLEVSARLALVLRQSGILKSGGGVNQVMSGLVTSILELGLEDSLLDHLVAVFKSRMLAVCKVLEESLPPSCSFTKPSGGYFIWVRLPESMDAAPFSNWCQKTHKVNAIPGQRFSVHGQFKNYLRLAIAFHSEDILVLAVRRLCQAIVEYIKLYHISTEVSQ